MGRFDELEKLEQELLEVEEFLADGTRNPAHPSHPDHPRHALHAQVHPPVASTVGGAAAPVTPVAAAPIAPDAPVGGKPPTGSSPTGSW